MMIESAAATTVTAAEATTAAAVTLVSDAAAMPTATQSAANGGPDGDDILRQSPCSKKGKPYKIETKDIGIQAYYAILQLCVGCRLMVSHSSHDTWGPSTCLIHVAVEPILE